MCASITNDSDNTLEMIENLVGDKMGEVKKIIKEINGDEDVYRTLVDFYITLKTDDYDFETFVLLMFAARIILKKYGNNITKD